MSVKNFGIVIDNATYKIYRSAELGRDGIDALAQSGVEFPKTIIYMNWEGYSFPFYFAIEEYKESIKRGFKFYHPHGEIRTYLDGDDPFNPTDRIDSFMRFGIFARRLFKPGNNEIVGGVDSLLRILNLILDPANQPVLFHCLGGMHRTGMVAMTLRMIQGWSMDAAEHEYRLFNPHLFRQSNVDFVAAFTADPRFQELVEKFQEPLKR